MHFKIVEKFGLDKVARLTLDFCVVIQNILLSFLGHEIVPNIVQKVLLIKLFIGVTMQRQKGTESMNRVQNPTLLCISLYIEDPQPISFMLAQNNSMLPIFPSTAAHILPLTYILGTIYKGYLAHKPIHFGTWEKTGALRRNPCSAGRMAPEVRIEPSHLKVQVSSTSC